LPIAASVQAFITIYVRRHDVAEHDLVQTTPPKRRRGRRRKAATESP
jgi:hypothetical protein